MGLGHDNNVSVSDMYHPRSCYRREMAGEEKQLVHRHREVYRRHEGVMVSGAKVVTCTLQTAMRRSV